MPRARAHAEGAIVQGGVEPPWGRVVDGIALGSPAFAQELRREACGDWREHKSLRGVPGMATWPQVVRALEQAKGENWNGFANRYGDWDRDAALRLGRQVGRLRLLELDKLAGGLDQAVVSKGIARCSRWVTADAALRNQLAVLQHQLSR